MGKGSQEKPTVDLYYLSMHQSPCIGPIDEMHEIFVGEKSIWKGNCIGNEVITVKDTELFGGFEKEGGVLGSIQVLFGSATQVLTDYLANKLQTGLTSATCPGFRGLFSLFFYGDYPGEENQVGQGFWWSAGSPYIKPVWITLFRKSPGLDPTKQFILDDSNPDAPNRKNINPANIIIECLTNTDWGMGAPTALINTSSFMAAQSLFFTEELMLSLAWMQQTDMESFVSEILDHVNATLYTNPHDGLLTIKAIRDDYDVDTLPVITPNNAEMTNFQRKLWGETINEIVATWTNPDNEEEESVTAQDLSNISIQGAVVSDNRNFYGVRSADLCMLLAQRDLRVASAPLIQASMNLFREFWAVVPGDVVKLTWPEHDVSELVMRVMKVDYGKPGDSFIKTELLQDVFSEETQTFQTPPDTQWTDPSDDPEPFELVKFMTTPYAFNEEIMGSLAAEALEPPENTLTALAAFPNNDTTNYDLMTMQPTPNGTLQWTRSANLVPVTVGTLSIALEFSTTSTEDVFFGNVVGTIMPATNQFVVIGDETKSDSETEIAIIMSGDATTGFSIRRGIFDTIPKDWPIHTRVWFVPADAVVIDKTIRSAGLELDMRLLGQTSFGRLDIDDADTETYTFVERHNAPIRPANVNINEDTWNEQIAIPEADWPVDINWSTRNRFQESAPPIRWDAAPVTPEDEQTTTIYVQDDDFNTITVIDDLAGNTHSLALADFADLAKGWIKVVSKRDGIESLTGKLIYVAIPDRLGWGHIYGKYYGEGLPYHASRESNEFVEVITGI